MYNASTFLSAEDIFSIWTPNEAPWSDWVKPVLFASLKENMHLAGSGEFVLPEINWLPSNENHCAIILDLPGEQAINEGLALVRNNYQPIPLINCCKAPGMVIDVDPIINAIGKGAHFLQNNPIKKNALPVFLIDSNRLSAKDFLSPGKFDNRWCVVPQDFPSTTKLKSFGIKSVLIRTTNLENDISHILKRYQVDGLKVSIQNPATQSIKEFSIPTISYFRSIWYRLGVLSGLRRNSAGGFGAVIPAPNSSGGHSFG